jgi:hypothetical protein
MFKGENTALWCTPFFIRRAVSAILVSGLCLLDFLRIVSRPMKYGNSCLRPDFCRRRFAAVTLLLVAVDY